MFTPAIDNASLSKYRVLSDKRWNCEAGKVKEKGLVKEKEGEKAFWIRRDQIWDALKITISENKSPDNSKQRELKRKPIAEMVQNNISKTTRIIIRWESNPMQQQYS